jgi:hypothetical protein
MANVSRPRGLSPVGTVTGAPFNEQGQLFAIANDATNTYAIGDLVTYAGGSDTNGVAYITKMTADSTEPLGVIVSIRPADPGVSLQGVDIDLGKLYIPQSAGLRYVYVVTDPNVVYEIQADTYALADVFKNAGGNYTAADSLSQSSPQSSLTLKASTVTALGTSGSLGLPFTVIGFAQRSDNAAGSYAKVNIVLNKAFFKQAQGTA